MSNVDDLPWWVFSVSPTVALSQGVIAALTGLVGILAAAVDHIGWLFIVAAVVFVFAALAFVSGVRQRKLIDRGELPGGE